MDSSDPGTPAETLAPGTALPVGSGEHGFGQDAGEPRAGLMTTKVDKSVALHEGARPPGPGRKNTVTATFFLVMPDSPQSSLFQVFWKISRRAARTPTHLRFLQGQLVQGHPELANHCFARVAGIRQSGTTPHGIGGPLAKSPASSNGSPGPPSARGAPSHIPPASFACPPPEL